MDKSEVIMKWLEDCPYIIDLFFIFSQAEKDNTVMVPETGYMDEWADGMPYIDGSGDKIYTFTLAFYLPYSTEPNSMQNVEIYQKVQSAAAWIDEQAKCENYPDFPKNCTINEMAVLPFDNGGFAGADETVAKYMFSIKIDYFYERM